MFAKNLNRINNEVQVDVTTKVRARLMTRLLNSLCFRFHYTISLNELIVLLNLWGMWLAKRRLSQQLEHLVLRISLNEMSWDRKKICTLPGVHTLNLLFTRLLCNILLHIKWWWVRESSWALCEVLKDFWSLMINLLLVDFAEVMGSRFFLQNPKCCVGWEVFKVLLVINRSNYC